MSVDYLTLRVNFLFSENQPYHSNFPDYGGYDEKKVQQITFVYIVTVAKRSSRLHSCLDPG